MITWDMLILKQHLLFIWNSNLISHLVYIYFFNLLNLAIVKERLADISCSVVTPSSKNGWALSIVLTF